MRQQQVIKVLIYISILNIVAMGIKFGIGLYINSSAVVADAFHSMTDLLANFVGIVALKLSYTPADENHGFGHEKIENVASLLISVVLVLTSIRIFSGAINSFFNPSEIRFSVVSVLLMLSTLVINFTIVIYERYSARKYQSEFLLADSSHTLSDIYITVGVIISMVLIMFGLPAYIDAIISIVISLIIFVTGVKVFLGSTFILIDTSIIDNKEIEAIINSFSEVREVHFLKNRGNQVNVYLDCHILFDKDMSVYDAHKIVDCIEQAIEEKYNYNFIFAIHIEPYIDKLKVN